MLGIRTFAEGTVRPSSVPKEAKSSSPANSANAQGEKTAVTPTEKSSQKRQPRSGKSGGKDKSGPLSKHVPPKESPYTELTRDRAEKLATLRRGWVDEFTWAAISGLFAALPGAGQSLMEALANKVTSKAHILVFTPTEDVNFAAFLVFAVLILVAFFRKENRGLNSMKYLELHYGDDPNIPKRKPFITRCRLWFEEKHKELFGPL